MKNSIAPILLSLTLAGCASRPPVTTYAPEVEPVIDNVHEKVCELTNVSGISSSERAAVLIAFPELRWYCLDPQLPNISDPLLQHDSFRRITEITHMVHRQIRYHPRDTDQKSTDMLVWGVRDRWATVGDMAKKSYFWDCEDSAIALYEVLALLGVDRSRLHLVLGQHAGGGAHAILLISDPPTTTGELSSYGERAIIIDAFWSPVRWFSTFENFFRPRLSLSFDGKERAVVYQWWKPIQMVSYDQLVWSWYSSARDYVEKMRTLNRTLHAE